jgi:hypothetical protein
VMGVPEALVVAERVPQELPLQPAPESVQRTPRPCRSLRTLAVNFWEPSPAWTLAVAGETATVMRDCAEARGTDARPIKVKTTKAARIDGQDAQSDFTNMRDFPPSNKRVEPRNMILIRRDSIGRGGGTIWKLTEIANRTKGHCSKLPDRTAWRQSRLGSPSCESGKLDPKAPGEIAIVSAFVPSHARSAIREDR